MIDRFEPTTKICYNCGTLNEIAFSNRIYSRSSCGLTEDRDIKAAKTIMKIGIIQNTNIGTECIEFTPVEIEPFQSVR